MRTNQFLNFARLTQDRSLALRASRITRHVLIGLLCGILALGCASDPPRTSGQYKVKKGDTLYSIAWRNGVDYRDLARLNGVGRDYAIHPGQILKLSSKKPSASRATTPSPQQTPGARVAVNAGQPMKWSWPVSGGSVKPTTRPNGGQGLMIGGVLGQEIRAAAAGRVVYTGTGLLGYGQLVIVKHSDTYLSAYGHTQTVRVHEQDAVQAGQTIATMGPGPTGLPALYFEIRVNGRPTDPMPMLPRP